MQNSTSTSDSDLNLYFYTPSTAAAVIFSVLYFLLTLWHGYINFIATRRLAYKHKYTIPLFVACVISTAGWSIRNASIHNLSSIPLYAVSASYIVISPIFVCASLYLLLTRLIRTNLTADKQQVLFHIPPRWLSRVFITSDVFSFLTQCSGSGIASSGNWEGDLKTVGTNVLLVGLSLQLATFTVFLVVLGKFVTRARVSSSCRAKDAGAADAGGLDPSVRKVVWAVWIAGFWVQVRSIYRVVEFGMGIDGYPFTHEWCLYVLEAVPMFIALTVLACYHPVKYMQHPPQKTQTDHALQERESRADAKRPSGGANHHSLTKGGKCGVVDTGAV
ncbi:uncharacterized protein Z520_00206 [Fonsecaea multimorphosa CBS 102226]|uniref:RTA1 domain protein n=1 Tax=Fonsecaea multimorphosa CBS 102226 TaxID=1442371 RepID=A0A0D2KJ58_9EURO|nr:uncharacterized protein Z520_00206 [Fonsecaea multimorphosa CBS 102226]KIY03515.1 hypothetical protein Z520_00206 [Fonsecaea multimorphosa CBS 102226]OAL32631.1 hypothetical protein AYO22_00244 [Fonsecaea multimorphosa]